MRRRISLFFILSKSSVTLSFIHTHSLGFCLDYQEIVSRLPLGRREFYLCQCG